MRDRRLELMHDHVRAIHRALTGEELPTRALPAGDVAVVTPEAVERRFAELERTVRGWPPIAERVPPFAFTPLLDVIEGERELVIELALPGVAPGDVVVALDDDGGLTVAGARGGAAPSDGRRFLHAEQARGPFSRRLLLPAAVSGEPRVDGEHGVVRVRLAKQMKPESARPSA